MKSISRFICLLILCSSSNTLHSQIPDSTTIRYTLQQNKANFEAASLRQLRQIAGAPVPFYTYFWELGDGSFSFYEHPEHRYIDTGLYNVQLFATNNYDDGKPPPIRKKPVKISSNIAFGEKENQHSLFHEKGAIEMSVNRMPRPDEDMVLIMGYRNLLPGKTLNGSLILFYNETVFKNDNFIAGETRTHHGETATSLQQTLASIGLKEISPSLSNQPYHLKPQQIFRNQAQYEEEWNKNDDEFFDDPRAIQISQLVKEKQELYRNNSTWQFNSASSGSEQYFFMTMHTTPEMLKDTNAEVTMTGVFIPDDPQAEIEAYELEMQIVSSHDPNRMVLKNRRLNYRFTTARSNNRYKVVFNNVGKGPAKNVQIGVAVPDNLKPGSLEVTAFKPRCSWCRYAQPGQSCIDTVFTRDSINFYFKNIYLPGLNQAYVNEPDSSMGFIKFELHFDKKEMRKLPFESRAAIVFDNNKPIITNSAKGKFKPGLSPAIIAGYSRRASDFDKWDAFAEGLTQLGASFSPYAPYRVYWQAEIMLGYRTDDERPIGFGTLPDTVINGQDYQGLQKQVLGKPTLISLEIAPLQCRYNFNSWVGGGIGSSVFVEMMYRIKRTEINTYRRQLMPPMPNNTVTFKQDGGTNTAWFKNWDISVFGDLQLGRVRHGPAFGIRFLHYFIQPRNRAFAYVTWRL